MKTSTASIIRHCLADLGITLDVSESSNEEGGLIYARPLLEECGSLDDQFAFVKKLYFARILEQHPDKVR